MRRGRRHRRGRRRRRRGGGRRRRSGGRSCRRRGGGRRRRRGGRRCRRRHRGGGGRGRDGRGRRRRHCGGRGLVGRRDRGTGHVPADVARRNPFTRCIHGRDPVVVADPLAARGVGVRHRRRRGQVRLCSPPAAV